MMGSVRSACSRIQPAHACADSSVLYPRLRKAAAGLRPDVLLAHVGAVRFPQTARITYTMDAAAVVDLAELTGAGIIAPVHIDVWSHFAQKERAAARAFEASRVPDHVRWLPLGEAVEMN